MTDPNSRHTWLSSLHHDGSDLYVSDPYPHIGDTVRIRIRVDAAAPVSRIVLRTAPDGEQALATMRRATGAMPPVQWWELDLPISEPVVHYRFIVESSEGIWHYSAAGPAAFAPLDSTDFRLLAGYVPPAWVRDSVFYQIFPDRFANGDPATDPIPDEFDYRGHGPLTLPWGERPPADHPVSLVYYGGDLPGIEQHLDYLQDLGVNALYLNPVFTAHSNHKYDVADYDNVDPHFGGNKALASLRRALSKRAMRYLLDIVPNHSGYWHPWFQAALDDPHAAERDFFTIVEAANDYATWLGVWSLPKLNYRSPELRERIYSGPDAVFRRWLAPPYSADGWRVDVANMLGRQGPSQIGTDVAHGIRQAVKETNPSAYLLGENFFDATRQLQGDQWDGVMNYDGFTHPLWFWLSGYRQGAHGFAEPLASSAPWPTAALVDTWRSRLAVIPWAIALQQYNVLDSHDTPRIRSALGENDALHRLAATVQMTYPGLPALYYGDEIGMVDEPGLNSRGCMIWDESRWDRDLHDFYRELIRLRRESSVLQSGGFQLLLSAKDTIAYQRASRDGCILVVAHRSVKPYTAGTLAVWHGGVPNGARFVEHFSGVEAGVRDGRLRLPPLEQGATIWRQVG